MARHIGIVACSAEGAALCYRTICVEGAGFLGPHAHPEVSMHTHSFAQYMPSRLSLEAQQRVGLARALTVPVEVLFLDSPLTTLAWRETLWWLDFLRRLPIHPSAPKPSRVPWPSTRVESTCTWGTRRRGEFRHLAPAAGV